jgi:hypothetical protein
VNADRAGGAQPDPTGTHPGQLPTARPTRLPQPSLSPAASRPAKPGRSGAEKEIFKKIFLQRSQGLPTRNPAEFWIGALTKSETCVILIVYGSCEMCAGATRSHRDSKGRWGPDETSEHGDARPQAEVWQVMGRKRLRPVIVDVDPVASLSGTSRERPGFCARFPRGGCTCSSTCSEVRAARWQLRVRSLGIRGSSVPSHAGWSAAVGPCLAAIDDAPGRRVAARPR